MPADERIKVIFDRVYVLDDADCIGSGEFKFTASVDGVRVGNPSQVFDANEGQWIDLPDAAWSAVVNVRSKTSVAVEFMGKDEDVFCDDDLGGMRFTLRPPWTQGVRRFQNQYFLLEWRVELVVDGTFGMHPPGVVFACREQNGGLMCNTVSGGSTLARMEFHPVLPVPPLASLPPRPAGLTGVAVNNGSAGLVINPTDAINVVPNPAVIPILTAAEANAQTAAKIEFTFYQPASLNFTDNDARLEWSITGSGGGAAAFFGPSTGRKIMVYGTAAGQVLLEVRFRGAVFASYRAMVAAIKQVPCRFNILNGPHANSQPRATPNDVNDHLAITNRFLRQIAVELVLDTNVTVSDGAVASAIPGIFRIRVAASRTRNIAATGFSTSTRLNYRPNVMNFAYIHSDANNNLGAATDYPASRIAPPAPGARPTVTDNGTPSNSWQVPSGVLPDGAAGAVTMQLLSARQRAGHPRLFAMYVTDGNGNPSVLADQQTYAGTIAHELGHILNLGHRVEGQNGAGVMTAGGIFWDGLTHPPGENIMHFNNPTSLAQDMDIVQAMAARASPLVPV